MHWSQQFGGGLGGAERLPKAWAPPGEGETAHRLPQFATRQYRLRWFGGGRCDLPSSKSSR